MTLLPIVERELRVAARRPRTFWVRLLVAVFAIVIGGGMLFFNPTASDPGSGRSIFVALVIIAFIYCLFVGRLSTADCLTEERREGTLGLLFLTDLKGVDIVLGKIAATSLGALFGLLAVVPVLAVTLLMGGVSNGEFWRVVLVLVDTFLFSLSLGIFASAVAREMRGAMAVNLLLFMLFVIGLPAGAVTFAVLDPTHRFVHQLFYSSPGYALWLCDDLRYRFRFWGIHYWCSVTTIHALTWVFTALACRIVPHSWQEQPVRPLPAAGQSRGLWQRLRYGTPARRLAYRKRLLDRNAFYWLASRSRFKPLQVWLFLAAAIGWWTWQNMNSQGFVWFESITQTPIMAIVNTALKLWVVLEATRCIAEVRKIGAMELLLSTPLTVPEIIRGQLLALARQFLRPLIVVAIGEVVLMNFVRRRTGDSEVTMAWLAGITMMFLDVVALSLVGMYAGLKSRGHNRAIMVTIAKIFLVPLALHAGVRLSMVAVEIVTGDKPAEHGWAYDLSWWFGLGLAADVFFGWRALVGLRRHFRELAAQRFTSV